MVDLEPCPVCGGRPRLRRKHELTTAKRCLVTCWYECRRWFGLRFCFVASPSWPAEKYPADWSRNAVEEARLNWNREVRLIESCNWGGAVN